MDSELESTAAVTSPPSVAMVSAQECSHPPIDADWSDVGCWPRTLSETQRVFIVETGPSRVADFNFPLNKTGRHFSPYYYTRKMTNGEIVDRRWLVYSKSCDSVFCFCCRLFYRSASTPIRSDPLRADFPVLSSSPYPMPAGADHDSAS